ncbi:KpsF/GutQ family sugar-phosphate isomerase [Rhizosaccharibacter radicis]|uniref:KpsF/GutQ family sugar-phosphate isomerase n=1 Tax=Rhizosaccharibacter radicis TaxID=2782605 RepID=A0ABT1VT67_9PROT|nr:KpsF/GutQ family sugar-phosphate isomerase [Acetobacteraceae bacterium KSS12]
MNSLLPGIGRQPNDAAAVSGVEPDAGMAARSVARTLGLERRGLEALMEALAPERADGLAAGFARAAAVIERAGGNVIVSGMGKSGHVGRKLSATLASTGTPSHFLHPAEASHGDLGVIRDNDVVLAMSWSGETPELADIVEHTRRLGVPLIAMTSRPDSALGQAADVGLFLPEAVEACPNGLAPTTSTTMQMVAGDALAILLLERQNFTATDFNRYHPGGKLGARLLQVRRLMHTGGAMPLVREDAMLSAGIVEMTSKRFGIAGVLDRAGALIGVLTDGDVRRAFQDGFRDRPVHEAMGRRPHIVAPDVLASQVLAEMSRARITCVFVVEAGRPVGLVHVHDLLRARVA